MIRFLAWGAAGVAWFALTFFIGLYVTFPSDVVRTRVEHESVAATDKQFAVSMDSIHPWFAGVRATDVTFYGLKRARRTKDVTEPGYERTPIITADSLVVKARPFDWVLGRSAVGWDASLLGGVLDGSYAEGEAAVDVAFHLAKIQLAQLGLSTSERTINLTGTLEGDADLHFDTENPKDSTGSFALRAEGFGLGAGSSVGGFNLPEAPFTRAVIAAEIDNGKLVIQEGAFEGSVIDAALTGDITINKKVLRSRHRLDLSFALPEEFDQLAQLSPTLKRSRDEEGRYHCTVNGQLFSPTFRCGKSFTPRKSSLSADRDGPGLGLDDEQSDEDRRIAREERMKERRERLKKRREEAAAKREEAGGATGPKLPAAPRLPNEFDDEPEDGPPPLDERFPPNEDDGFIPGNENDGPPADDLWLPGDDQTR